MNLIRLFGRLDPVSIRRLLLSATVSALASTAVLAIINAAAQEIATEKKDSVNLALAAVFVVCVMIYWVSESRMVAWMAADVEEAIDGLRMTLLDRLRKADLRKLECFGQTSLYESITQSCQVISQNSQFLAVTLHSAILTVLILVYIASVSMLAFALIGVLLGVGTVAYVKLGQALDARQNQLSAEEAQMFESVSDLFDGFKEQRLNSARSNDLNETFAAVSVATNQASNTVHMHSWQQFVFGETAFNLMLGVVVFVVPAYSQAFAGDLVKIAAAVLFLEAPVFALMQSLAIMRAAEAAAGRMLDLEAPLTALAEAGSDGRGCPVPSDFSELVLAGVEFAFPAPEGESPFVVGPFDLTIRRGEVVFVTGGNGSGKSTFIKLLTGLYRPIRGTLTVDGVVIGSERLAAYREQMATVFADFHLFARLYGMDPPDPQEADALMRRVEMNRITALVGDCFERNDLSTGQRKRLALVSALLEKKPILILDEWAADQDPHFRFTFYREILPYLKSCGLTIIAVTHDDRYIDVADRRLHMKEGRLIELPPVVEAPI
jgi:putative ATP-binding cassette transporter